MIEDTMESTPEDRAGLLMDLLETLLVEALAQGEQFDFEAIQGVAIDLTGDNAKLVLSSADGEPVTFELPPVEASDAEPIVEEEPAVA